METSDRDRPSDSEKSSPDAEEELAPPPEFPDIVEMAGDMVLCEMAIETHRGGWCDGCACRFKYHVEIENGECELCGCYEQYRKTLPVPVFVTAAQSEKEPDKRHRRVLEEQPLKIMEDIQQWTAIGRNREARKALKDLTE